MAIMTIEVVLEVSSPATDTLDDELRKDVVQLLRRRAQFTGYSRHMQEIAASPVGCREVSNA